MIKKKSRKIHFGHNFSNELNEKDEQRITAKKGEEREIAGNN